MLRCWIDTRRIPFLTIAMILPPAPPGEISRYNPLVEQCKGFSHLAWRCRRLCQAAWGISSWGLPCGTQIRPLVDQHVYSSWSARFGAAPTGDLRSHAVAWLVKEAANKAARSL